LVADWGGRLHYAVYCGYIEFDVHRGYGYPGRPIDHRERWFRHSTGFGKKFLILPPRLISPGQECAREDFSREMLEGFQQWLVTQHFITDVTAELVDLYLADT
jgi:hypothetical protein